MRHRMTLPRRHLRILSLRLSAGHVSVLQIVWVRARRHRWHAHAHLHSWSTRSHVLGIRVEALVGGGVLHHMAWSGAASVWACGMHMWCYMLGHWGVGGVRLLVGHHGHALHVIRWDTVVAGWAHHLLRVSVVLRSTLARIPLWHLHCERVS